MSLTDRSEWVLNLERDIPTTPEDTIMLRWLRHRPGESWDEHHRRVTTQGPSEELPPLEVPETPEL